MCDHSNLASADRVGQYFDIVGYGNHDRDRGSLARLAPQPDFAAHDRDDALDDREPEAEAGLPAAALEAEERREHLFDLVFGNARPVVLDRNDEKLLFRFAAALFRQRRGDADGAAPVLDRVRDEILENDLEAPAPDENRPEWDVRRASR